MLFNSVPFILGFLPLVLVGFHLLSRHAGPGPAIAGLIAASLVFYGWWEWTFVFLLLGSTLGNFLGGLLLARWRHRWLLAMLIAANLGILGWYKYAGFLAANINTLFGTGWSVGGIVLPLAISFFTFQQIAYLVDVYRGLARERDVLRYALFVTFFPQLIAGPIVHHGEMLPQFAKFGRQGLRADDFAVGASIFAIGLLKKVAIADTLAVPADRIFGLTALGEPVTFITAWFGTFCFGLQIYFDFSGYSDMAIGLARMFGIRLPLNFHSPYKAASIIDFWRHWHMTLSRFLRDYLYLPLGGSRRGAPRRYVNLMIVMLLGGLWHGAAWTFVLWGGLHGLYLVVNHGWRAIAPVGPGGAGPARRLAGQGLTLAAVFFAWALFRAENGESAILMVQALTGQTGILLPASYLDLLGPAGSAAQGLGIAFGAGADAEVYPTRNDLVMVGVILLATLILPNTQQWMHRHQPALDTMAAPGGLARAMPWQPSAWSGAGAALACFAGLALLLRQASNAFIYFQF